MLIEDLHHIAVIVANVEKSAAFYERVFELSKIERLTAKISHNRGAWYKIGAKELHLQEREGEIKKTEQHFALISSDFDLVWQRVKEYGGRVEEGKLIEGFRKRGFVYDIDGNRIELLER